MASSSGEGKAVNVSQAAPAVLAEPELVTLSVRNFQGKAEIIRAPGASTVQEVLDEYSRAGMFRAGMFISGGYAVKSDLTVQEADARYKHRPWVMTLQMAGPE
jgi:hypothetical protein